MPKSLEFDTGSRAENRWIYAAHSMGLMDRMKRVADQAQHAVRSAQNEIDALRRPGVAVAGQGDPDGARRQQPDVRHGEEQRQNDLAISAFFGFDPFCVVTDMAVASALGFDVVRRGTGGGDYEVGPRYESAAQGDDRSVSVCFLYPPEFDVSDWNAPEQAAYYAEMLGDAPIELRGVGERAWSATGVVVVSAVGRAFYVSATGTRPATVDASALIAVARLVADSIPQQPAR